MSLRIVELQKVSAAAAVPSLQSLAPEPKPVWKAVLEWTGPTHGTYTVERSADLQSWSAVPVETLPAPAGVFRVRCDVTVPSVEFYRLRHTP